MNKMSEIESRDRERNTEEKKEHNKNSMKENTGGDLTVVSLSRSDSNSAEDTSEDEVSTVHEIEDQYGSQSLDIAIPQQLNPPAVVANITDSTNVEIKPTTHAQYYAPVTIHHYLNAGSPPNNFDPSNQNYGCPLAFDSAPCGKSAKPDAESEPQVVLDTSWKILYHAIKTNVRWKLAIAFALVAIVIVVVVAVCLSVKTNANVPSDEDPTFDLGNETYIFPKHRWGGLETQPSEKNRTLLHPTNMVVVAHTASPKPCMSQTACSHYLQAIQTMHISEYKYVDISYNFMIGGDGNVYEGLGWDLQNYLRKNSIAIAFTGNYAIYPLNERQRTTAQKLMETGVELGKLDKDYILVAHSQISATLSPGKFLVKDIKKWPHYSRRLFV